MDNTTVDTARDDTVTATVRVVGIDLDSPETGDVLATQFPTLIWEERDHLVTATMTVAADDAITHLVDLCRRLEGALTGVKVDSVVRDFVNATDIATRVELSREAVRKWTVRADFPTPEAVVGGDSMKIWTWTQVVSWLKTARGIDMGQALLSVQQMTQLENCLMRNPDHTTVQWHKAAARPAPVFQRTQRAASRGVFVDASSGRGHSRTATSRPALVPARLRSLPAAG